MVLVSEPLLMKGVTDFILNLDMSGHEFSYKKVIKSNIDFMTLYYYTL